MLRGWYFGWFAPGSSRASGSGPNAPNLLVATPKGRPAAEAARARPGRPDAPARDAVPRLPTRPEPDPDALRADPRPHVARDAGAPGADDSALGPPDATATRPAARHRPGEHQAVARGTSPVPPPWADGGRHAPCDHRAHGGADGRAENGHPGGTTRAARARGSRPGGVRFDGRHRRPGNPEPIRACGRVRPTRSTANRLASRDRQGPRAVGGAAVAATGTEVRPTGVGVVRVSGTAAPDGGTASRAASDLGVPAPARRRVAGSSRAIGSYRRGVRPRAGAERCRCRPATARRGPIGLALRSEVYCFARGVSRVEAETGLVRAAVRECLTRPRIRLPYPATA